MVSVSQNIFAASKVKPQKKPAATTREKHRIEQDIQCSSERKGVNTLSNDIFHS